MNVLLALALRLVEFISPSENREALCGDLLERQRAGCGRRWLLREILAALGTAVIQRLGRFGIPLLFSLSWSALYRGYAARELAVFQPSWAMTVQVFPLHAVVGLLLQIVPVITFIWIGFALFLCIRKDVVRSMSAVGLASALSASHAALLILMILWPKHMHSSTLLHLFTQTNFYVGWVNVPVAVCMLIAILMVLPKYNTPPRRRRRRRVPLREHSLHSHWKSHATSIRNLRHCLVWIAVSSTGCTGALAGQSTRPALTPSQLSAIDSFVHGEMQREKIPGLALGVYSRGSVLLAKGYGLSNVELRVPVMPETLFQSGSVGKQFLATAVLMLSEEGKLSLDDSVAKYFPDAPAAWQPIRIRNLLSHTSGLAEYETPERTAPNGPFYLRLDFTEDELVRKIESLPIEAAPGEKWKYCNTNYVLLGILLHRVTGMPYAEFLQRRIFQPLGMTATRLISESDIVPDRAAGYELSGSTLRNQSWVSPTFNSTGDGTLYFNVIDLAKWDAALYTTRLLQQSSLDRMWTIFKLNNGKPNSGSYGFGWELDPQNGHRRIEHGGSWQGFTCEISRYPDDALTVVVLTNLDSAHSRPAVFSHVIAGLIEPQLEAPKLAAIPDDDPDVAVALRRLLDSIMTGRGVPDQLSDTFRKAATPAVIESVRKQLEPMWPGGTLILVRRAPKSFDPDKRVSLFRLQKGEASMLVFLARDADGRVNRFGLHADSEY